MCVCVYPPFVAAVTNTGEMRGPLLALSHLLVPRCKF